MQRKGGYNRRNFLLRVQRVNEVYLFHSKRGVFVEHIFRNYVRDEFLISRSTFYQYLSIPYKRELEELDRKQNTQLDLFNEPAD